MNPTLSVVLTTFNRSGLFKKALDSVLCQTAKDFEIIILDDGSTDNTKSSIENYLKQDPRIKYFYQNNRGIAAAKNAAIEKCSGEYIAFLDSDDLWMPDKIEKQLQAIKSQKNMDLIYTDATIISHDGEETGRYYIRPSEKNIQSSDYFTNLLIRYFIPFSSIMAKKTLFTHIGKFLEEFDGVEDYEWAMRIVSHTNFHFIDEPLIKYRMTANNVSSNLEKRHSLTLRILNLYKQKTDSLPATYRAKLNKRYAQTLYGLGYAYYENDKIIEARDAFLESICFGPCCDPKKYLLWLLCSLPGNVIAQVRNKRVTL